MSSEPVRSRHDSDWDVRNPFRKFKFSAYLKEELFQSVRKQQEQTGADDRGPFNNRMHAFLTVPQYFESFMRYGLLQCLDQLLVVYTFLPIRCIFVVFRLLTHLFCQLVSPLTRIFYPSSKSLPDPKAVRGQLLYSHELRDICRFFLMMLCSSLLATFDSSVAYHEIRTQSVVKIYIFFNLLEVADRLLSAVCQDALDDLFHTVSKTLHNCYSTATNSPGVGGSVERVGNGHMTAVDPSNGGDMGSAVPEAPPGTGTLSLTWDLFFQFGFALVCLFAHCFLLLCQVTTLNVAFNSQNKSLVTVFISNNFVELKGNVFRKMGKTNLFQIACADVRERFHYSVWLFIVVCRNMTDTGWNLDDLWEMLFDVLCIFLAEVAVDWVKHAFITKFNIIPSDYCGRAHSETLFTVATLQVYDEYTVSLAFDLLLCRQGNNTADYFDLLSRRMGLTPIPLSCLINVMLFQTVRGSSSLFFYSTLPLLILVLFILKMLVNICLLAAAYSHVRAYIKVTQAANQQQALSNKDTGVVVMAATPNQAGALPTTTEACEPHSTPTNTAQGAWRFNNYDQPTQDEHSFWSAGMVLRHRRIRTLSEMSYPVQTSVSHCRLKAGHSGDVVEAVSMWPSKAKSSLSGDETLTSKRIWSDKENENHDHAYLNGGNVSSHLAKETNIGSNNSINRSASGSYYNNPTTSTSMSSVFDPRDLQNTTPIKLTSDSPVLSSSLMERLSQEDLRQTGHIHDSSTPPFIQGQELPQTATDRILPIRRSYSIDIGVLSTFGRQVIIDGDICNATQYYKPPVLTKAVDSSAQTEGHNLAPAMLKRRRHRVRTWTESSEDIAPRSSDHALHWEEDILPVLWEKSSRNSVVQPPPVMDGLQEYSRSGEVLVPQPLPNIDRYSMLEGQIS